MIFKKTKIEGLYIVEPELKTDERGYFVRNFCKEEFNKVGIQFDIAQASQSFTKKRGTIRGMHFQKEPKGEKKIVQCMRGAIYDVVIDLREDSKTYGHWIGEELTEENRKMLFIPKNCAHGFQTLTSDCLLQYFMSELYYPELVFGVRWDDPLFNIKWPLENKTISERDQNWPLLKI
ncbi:MAG: dTDP-4-dehydrorhamnose 3,5-epimerase [Candidatus Staskawiczbacteria bacterium]|jgi:dTDP-4-dehydrorhamnose 3,5-epimerase